MSYKHITSNQRNELSALLIARIKKKDIAQQLGKDRTTIWRELKRNVSKSNRNFSLLREVQT